MFCIVPKRKRTTDVGAKFGRLTMVGEPFRMREWSGTSIRAAVWLCDCGGRHIAKLHEVKHGHVTSCGCAAREQREIRLPEFNTTHGLTGHPLYIKWASMNQRCRDPGCKSYPDYGGRGIVVCEEWKSSFQSFYNWAIRNGWEDGLQIDRIDNDGDYEPTNCRFVTRTVNARNKRSNIQMAAFGEVKRLHQWAKDPRCVVSLKTLRRRYHHGWDPERALTQKGRPLGNRGKLEGFGEMKTLAEWSRDPRCLVSQHSLQQRLRRGWTLEYAMTEPNRRPRRCQD